MKKNKKDLVIKLTHSFYHLSLSSLSAPLVSPFGLSLIPLNKKINNFCITASSVVFDGRGDCVLCLLQVRNWEERLQMTAGEDNVDKLCALAQDHLKLYRQRLPKPGRYVSKSVGSEMKGKSSLLTTIYN